MSQEKPIHGLTLILGYMGFIVMLVGFITLLPLLTLLFFAHEMNNFFYFFTPGIASIIVGYLLTFLVRGRNKGKFRHHQESVILVGAWVVAILVAAMPFMMTGYYSFTHAVFEMTSGFTATGFTVVDVESAPRIFLMHRSLSMFFGGVGLLLVLMSVLQASHGMKLYSAEGHRDRLLPNLIKSARLIFAIYAGYILAGMGIYRFLGMSWFDAINHSISAFATGGFSTRAASIGAFDSFAIEMATVVFMLLGATTFVLHLFLLRGRFRDFLVHCETKFLSIILAFFVPVVAFVSVSALSLSWGEAFRYAVFDVAAVVSTTGYRASNFAKFQLPSTAFFLFLILFFVGGQAGSTAGGIKLYRVWIVIKNLWWKMRGNFANKRVVSVNIVNKFGKVQVVDNEEVAEISAFVFQYICIVLAGAFVFTLFGYSAQDSLFEFASAMGTMGYTTGILNYNAHPVVLWTGILGMLIGRLEIIAIYLGIGCLISGIKRRIH